MSADALCNSISDYYTNKPYLVGYVSPLFIITFLIMNFSCITFVISNLLFTVVLLSAQARHGLGGATALRVQLSL